MTSKTPDYVLKAWAVRVSSSDQEQQWTPEKASPGAQAAGCTLLSLARWANLSGAKQGGSTPPGKSHSSAGDPKVLVLKQRFTQAAGR